MYLYYSAFYLAVIRAMGMRLLLNCFINNISRVTPKSIKSSDYLFQEEYTTLVIAGLLQKIISRLH